jgi:hypothetical protein
VPTPRRCIPYLIPPGAGGAAAARQQLADLPAAAIEGAGAPAAPAAAEAPADVAAGTSVHETGMAAEETLKKLVEKLQPGGVMAAGPDDRRVHDVIMELLKVLILGDKADIDGELSDGGMGHSSDYYSGNALKFLGTSVPGGFPNELNARLCKGERAAFDEAVGIIGEFLLSGTADTRAMGGAAGGGDGQEGKSVPPEQVCARILL